MVFGRQRESGLSAELTRARREFDARTQPVSKRARAARAEAVRIARDVDARAVSLLVGASRRAGRPVSAEYVQGALHTVLAAGVAGFACVALARGAWRIRTAGDVPARLVGSGRSFAGLVARAGDGDGVRVLHLPPLRVPLLARRRLARARAADTVSVRLAGVDAPECAHFGQPGQAFGKDARRWLAEYAVGRRVRVVVHAVDQYHRALASVYRCAPPPLRWMPLRCLRIGERNVSVELARAGYATVYEGGGAQFGGARRQIERAVASARRRGVGMWAAKGALETPAQFKRRLRSGAALPKGMAAAKSEPVKKAEELGVQEVLGVARRVYEYLKTLR